MVAAGNTIPRHTQNTVLGARASGRGSIVSGWREAFALGAASGQPVLINISPTPIVAPGGPGAFSIDFSVARLTPITFDVTGTNGAQLSIVMSFDDRNEVYVARDFDGAFRWPFDVPVDNAMTSIAIDPVHVHLFPRGGWPPTIVRMQVASVVASS